jgi:hypothetical protein
VSRRLTIAVPESLYERLQKVKHSLNISAVCQEALEMAINLTELKTDSFDREKLIERLRLERKAVRVQIKEKGFNLGLKSAHNLSYQEFQRFEQRSRIQARFDEAAFADMWELLESRQPAEEMELEEVGLKSFLPLDDSNKGAFMEGWIEGVLSVWRDIKDQVNNDEL